MSRFAVSVVSPFGYVHSAAFDEVALSLHSALQSLGHDSIISSRLDNRRRQHIVLGANLLARYPQPLPADAVIYNLEQVYPESPWMTQQYLDVLRRHRVWDYSQRNIERLRELGVAAEWLPIGYVPALTRIEPAAKDIDVLFYGSINERRKQVLVALMQADIKLHVVCGVYGKERDALIARSRIVLNLHYYEAKLFEIVRVAYLLSNRVCVVSERGDDPELVLPFEDGIEFADYADLATACVRLLDDEPRRQTIAQQGLDCIKAQPLAPALAALLAEVAA